MAGFIEVLDALSRLANQPTYDAVDRGRRYGALRGIDDFFDENLGTKYGPNIGSTKGLSGIIRAQNGIGYNSLPDDDYGAWVGALYGRNAINRSNAQAASALGEAIANSVARPQMGTNYPIKNRGNILNGFIR